MDRQPLTDRLGDRLLAEYGGAAAAYSLRALNGNGDSVVRVRRASDNDEKDFTAEQIELGEMVNWVNSQTVPPLDIGVETSEGRIPVPEGGTSIGTPAAAYSLRNLSTTYTGNVVDVRRSSDDAEESFTAEEVSDGTLTTWVGAGNDGFVSKWYDQSGNDNHATQGTDASQPTIVDGGSLVSGGIDFDNVDDYLNLETAFNISTDFAIFGTLYSSNFSIGGRIFHEDGNNNVRVRNATYDFRYRSNGVNYDFGIGNSFTNNNQSLFSFLNSGDEHSLFVDGSLKGQNTITDNFLMSAISDSSTGIALGASVSELIIYPSDQSDNRTAIEANIGETYGITGIPAYDNTVDGFVETWYDQSGNGNDATQSVAGSQPKIVDGGSLVSGGIDFDGVDDFLELGDLGLSQPNSVVFVHNSDADGGISNEFLDGTTVSSGRTLIDGLSTSYRIFAGDSSTTSKTIVANQDAIVFTTLSDGSSEFSLDGSNETGLTAGTNGMDEMTLGASISGGRYDGTFAELIIYPSNQSDNRTAIEGNINAHYDIY